MTSETNPAHTAFYVSAIDGPGKWLLSGPYASHATALAMVAPVRERAIAGRPRAHFYAFGTCGHGPEVEPIKTPLGPEWVPATV